MILDMTKEEIAEQASIRAEMRSIHKRLSAMDKERVELLVRLAQLSQKWQEL